MHIQLLTSSREPALVLYGINILSTSSENWLDWTFASFYEIVVENTKQEARYFCGIRNKKVT